MRTSNRDRVGCFMAVVLMAVIAFATPSSFAQEEERPRPRGEEPREPREPREQGEPRAGDRRGPGGEDRREPLDSARDRPRPVEWNEEDERVLLALLAERDAPAAERLEQLRASDPEQFKQAARRMMDSPRMRPLLEMRRRDPAGFELQTAAMRARANAGRLRRQLDQAQGSDSDSMRTQLHEAAGQVVDAEFKLREHELAQLEKRLSELKKDLEYRKTNRDAMIEEYVERLSERRRPGPGEFVPDQGPPRGPGDGSGGELDRPDRGPEQGPQPGMGEGPGGPDERRRPRREPAPPGGSDGVEPNPPRDRPDA